MPRVEPQLPNRPRFPPGWTQETARPEKPRHRDIAVVRHAEPLQVFRWNVGTLHYPKPKFQHALMGVGVPVGREIGTDQITGRPEPPGDGEEESGARLPLQNELRP